ncbi:polysaccharide biosynthesis protein [Fodinicola feengrottensis]|uniref:hypothetical protein n=1 Tax=Fodinicola feengrottensis TaxID=435914 RepID=UPI0013D55589|nr:hypothetical protein [Fodinicola feengrottensis]
MSPPGRGLLARRASSALVSQGITAFASLVLQLVAARTLGAAGLGLYALCVSVLITATALYTGWVGDSVTVLDRFEPQIRAAISVSVIIGAAGGFLAGLAYLLFFGGGTLSAAFLLGVLITCWLLERRPAGGR